MGEGTIAEKGPSTDYRNKQAKIIIIIVKAHHPFGMDVCISKMPGSTESRAR